jgi:2-desacetyl-2-hydroxyethyl bacteriochlorophyllide A dehydrogenase
MLTALLKAPRMFEIVERPIPTAGPGEVLVRTAATAVCHTDLGMYTGHAPGTKYPVVLGHESTGTIEVLGPGVTGLKPGQNVIINPIIACGHCDSCLGGRKNLCRNAGLFGREVEGSMNQYVRLAAEYVFPLPPNVSLADATIIETLATVRHAQERTRIKPGESVVVFGGGTAGLLHVRLAVLSGADPVMLISRSKWKLDMGVAMGAHHAIQKDAEAAVEDVLELTNGQGVDVVIDTAGTADTLRIGIDMLKPGGRFSSFSLGHEPFEGFSPFPLYYKELTIIGSRGLVAEDMQPSIDLVAAGKIDVAGFVTGTYPLTQAAAAFKEYEENPGRILRLVIDSRAT